MQYPGCMLLTAGRFTQTRSVAMSPVGSLMLLGTRTWQYMAYCGVGFGTGDSGAAPDWGKWPTAAAGRRQRARQPARALVYLK